MINVEPICATLVDHSYPYSTTTKLNIECPVAGSFGFLSGFSSPSWKRFEH